MQRNKTLSNTDKQPKMLTRFV